MSLRPYHDTKPEGAPDFYFVINATLRFLLRRFGRDGLARWVRDLAGDYFRSVNELWREGGLPVVAAYWREFYAAEPGGDVEIMESGDRVEVQVRECPAIGYMRANGREIVPDYCQQCAAIVVARAKAAGLSGSVLIGSLFESAVTGEIRKLLCEIRRKTRFLEYNSGGLVCVGVVELLL